MTSQDIKENKTSREKAIVKHSNQLAEVPLQNFTAKEVDMFFALCLKLQGAGENRVTISFDDVRKIIGSGRRGDKALLNELREMAIKFSRINLMTQETDSSFKIIIPFTDFEGDWKQKTFSVGVHKEFVSALNDLDGTPGKRYTLSDVMGISRMKSTFSKHCLKMIFLYRNAGYWYTTIGGLRYYLDIPDGYKPNDIKRRVIDVIKAEFDESGIFEKFEVIERREEGSRSPGRKKLIGYTFHFVFSEDADVSTYESEILEELKCPKCGRPLVRKARRDGTGYFYGHEDGYKEDALCRYTVNMGRDTEAEMSESSGEATVTERVLADYYEYVRREEELAAVRRREEIEKAEPEIWELYEERERRMADYVKQMQTLGISGEREDAKKAVDDATSNLLEGLKKKGYAEDYMFIRHRCNECRDTGQRDDGMYCSCRKDRVAEAAEWLKSEKK